MPLWFGEFWTRNRPPFFFAVSRDLKFYKRGMDQFMTAEEVGQLMGGN
jgi:hypothetical protein